MVFNFGINDSNGDSSRKHKDNNIYNSWYNMLKRCYSPSFHKIEPSYIDITVCDDWKHYSNYKQWFKENYIQGYEIDKDIAHGYSKIYSPRTCFFVPKLINNCILEGTKKYQNIPLVYRIKIKVQV
ncbi:putative HNH endonuclease [Escherichia phage A4]|nr:putative HNH endonuclease [Escherichia phage A4]